MKNFKLRRYPFTIILLFLSIISVSLFGCKNTSNEPISSMNSKEQPVNLDSQSDEDRQSSDEDKAIHEDGLKKDIAYLKEYFDIEVSQGGQSKEIFYKNLDKLSVESKKAEGEWDGLQAIHTAVIAAGNEELALTYSIDKARDRLNKYNIDIINNKEFNDIEIMNLACALDTGLITSDMAKKALNSSELSQEDVVYLYMSIVNSIGEGRNYLGYSDDIDIYSKLNNMWNSFLIYDDKELTNLGKSAVENGITTGYNLKNRVFDARFLSDLTLQYGHSDIKHAQQLIGLLGSEDITAKIQLEPKVSVYQYLLEWGSIPDASPTYEVKQYEDLYLVYAVEYDLMLEFQNDEDLFAFDTIIEQYAKKNDDNEEGNGLLYASWWQPLYSVTREDMPSESYHKIYDYVVENGDYSIHPFSLPEELDYVSAEFQKFNKKLKAVPEIRYCNQAFYNYMRGEDYQ